VGDFNAVAKHKAQQENNARTSPTVKDEKINVCSSVSSIPFMHTAQWTKINLRKKNPTFINIFIQGNRCESKTT